MALVAQMPQVHPAPQIGNCKDCNKLDLGTTCSSCKGCIVPRTRICLYCENGGPPFDLRCPMHKHRPTPILDIFCNLCNARNHPALGGSFGVCRSKECITGKMKCAQVTLCQNNCPALIPSAAVRCAICHHERITQPKKSGLRPKNIPSTAVIASSSPSTAAIASSSPSTADAANGNVNTREAAQVMFRVFFPSGIQLYDSDRQSGVLVSLFPFITCSQPCGSTQQFNISDSILVLPAKHSFGTFMSTLEIDLQSDLGPALRRCLVKFKGKYRVHFGRFLELVSTLCAESTYEMAALPLSGSTYLLLLHVISNMRELPPHLPSTACLFVGLGDQSPVDLIMSNLLSMKAGNSPHQHTVAISLLCSSLVCSKEYDLTGYSTNAGTDTPVQQLRSDRISVTTFMCMMNPAGTCIGQVEEVQQPDPPQFVEVTAAAAFVATSADQPVAVVAATTTSADQPVAVVAATTTSADQPVEAAAAAVDQHVEAAAVLQSLSAAPLLLRRKAGCIDVYGKPLCAYNYNRCQEDQITCASQLFEDSMHNPKIAYKQFRAAFFDATTGEAPHDEDMEYDEDMGADDSWDSDEAL